ncbi:predicted protein [Sclerotinia sclerotiorum 1980 UF-70]|uniref:Uncharacterized protein n=1 Tax=Sclerotinia sclerotiorum (strain ATCC 18683 / 1980 / Ss-1) TaxID=665079 RepID=A7EIL2_SCLS1|nr:predicted protein [Sclerotinia sclerotiorum 1980 UF-70]EDO02678.1 predicted protein [Sclerotinia sclerotiorum 1980 UF-70]
MSSNFRNSIKAIVSRRTAYIQITPDTKFIEGLIVRITAEELHIQDVGFLDAVYAPSASPRNKSRYDVHNKRCAALSPFFSKRNVLILHLEPLINKKVEQLCEMIDK